MSKLIQWQDFEKVDIRAGKIINVKDFLEAVKPAYIIYVDFGSDIGVLKTSAQVTQNYMPGDLIGKSVLGLVNLPSKQIGPHVSQFLLLGCTDPEGAIVLAEFTSEIELGSKLH